MSERIVIGIRRSSGNEHWLRIRSKGLDYLLHNPDFQREGVIVDQLTDNASTVYNHSMLVVDFKNGIIFSRQGYCAMDHVLASGENGLQCIKEMYNAGDIKQIRREHPLNPYCQEVINFKQAIKLLEIPARYVYIIPQGPLKIDHDCKQSDKDSRHQVRTFIKTNGWKSLSTK